MYSEGETPLGVENKEVSFRRNLEKVGLEPEMLTGKTLIVFGEGFNTDEDSLIDVTLSHGDIDHYDETDVVHNTNGELDFILAVDDEDFQQIDPWNVGLLAAAVRAVKPSSGEVRINLPSLAFPQEQIPDMQRDYAMALSDEQVDATVTYVITDPTEPYYVLVRPIAPK